MLSFSGLILVCASVAAPQEPSLVPGSYRGPDDDFLFVDRRTSPLTAPSNGLGASMPLSERWDRWEFWFEHERDVLFRGEPDYPARAVEDDGRYGDDRWSVARQDVLLTSMPLLLDALVHEEPALREAAALSLGRIGYPAAEVFLERATNDRVPSVRQAALLGLGLLASPRTTGALTERFDDATAPEGDRVFAALGLGLSGRVEAGSALKMYLNRVYHEKSWKAQGVLLEAAMLAAGVHGSPDFAPLIMNLQTELRGRSGSASARAMALHALGALGDDRARPLLEDALQSTDPGVPQAAAQALGRLGDLAAVPALKESFLATNDAVHRSLCLLALGRLGGHAATVALEELEPERHHPELERSAWSIAAGLAQVKSVHGALERRLLHGSHVANRDEGDGPRRDEQELRGAVAMGLGLFGNPEAVDAFRRALGGESLQPGFVGYVATALGLLGHGEADEILLDLAEQPLEPDARRGLANGLGLSGSERTSIALVELLIADEHPEVRYAAARSLSLSRSTEALRRLADAVRVELQAARQGGGPARAAHLVLALGFLGDVHEGATLSSLVAGHDFRQESKILTALRKY